MQIQSAPLPPDVEYFLDAALEHEELDAGSHTALKLYAPRVDLMAAVDSDWKLGIGTKNPRLAICGRLTDMADGILTSIPEPERGAIAYAGVYHMKGLVSAMAWCMAGWAMEDEIQGGCMEPYKTRLSRKNQRYELSPRQERKLYAPGWVRRYVKLSDESARLRRMGSLVIRRAAPVRREHVDGAAQLLHERIVAAHEGYRAWSARQVRAHAAQLNLSKLDSKDARKAQRKSRRVIKRAVACAESVVGRDAVTMFAQGRAVLLEGTTLCLEVSRLGSAASQGHGAISVSAVHKDSRRRLADMCVYHEKTPALDQLTALALAMQAGEEDEIIKTANLSRVSDLGMEHPLIAERGRLAKERAWSPDTEKRAKNEAYFQATKGMWIESLGVHVLGRMWN